jgi:ELWxxDGT repeat protein
MYRQTVLFEGVDTNNHFGLWVTDGTAAGTHELNGISGAYSGGLFVTVNNFPFTVFNGKVLFDGHDASGNLGLWVTNGTAGGTHELTGISGAAAGGLFANRIPPGMTVFNGEVLFEGFDTNSHLGLWVTDGTAAGTHELTGISGANPGGIEFGAGTVFNSEVLFGGSDASGSPGLWVTNGTAAGTSELTGISGAYAGLGGGTPGLSPADMTIFNGKVLFEGADTDDFFGLWVTNGTSAGTSEVGGIGNSGISGASSTGLDPIDLTVFNGEVLFRATDTSGKFGLWVTNGTAPGTFELTGIAGANSNGLLPTTPDMTVFNGEVLFQGADASGNSGLWVTNGTAGGTSELTGISGAFSGGIFSSVFGPAFAVFNGEVLFEGTDASNKQGLWVTNGTSAGTHELTGIAGASTSFSGLEPLSLASVTLVIPPLNDFTGTNTSDILFRNLTSGDTWFEAPAAPNPWNQIGGSDTTYSVVGTGDFYGTGTTDILFRNNSSGDTWFEGISNGAFAGWNQIGGSDTHYSVAGIGDFYGTGTSDILFLNISTGDTWFEAISNGAFAGWHQIGGSDTHYTAVGVGDFFGNGTDDILFRNNSTGDTWIEAISNGAFAGWHQIGGSDTTYSVVGIGDYFGTGTSDILFLNASTGDTWFEAVSNGASAGWNHIGSSNTSYSVPITVGPPALT